MKSRTHAQEVYSEGNFRIAMIAVDPRAEEQVPKLKGIAALIEAKREWLKAHTALDIHPDEKCFGVHTIQWVRLEDGRKYHTSFLFLAKKNSMTPADWDSVVNQRDPSTGKKSEIKAYRNIALSVFPDLETDPPAYQHSEGKDPRLVVRLQDTLRYLVGAGGWRMKLLNAVSTMRMEFEVVPLGKKLERKAISEPAQE